MQNKTQKVIEAIKEYQVPGAVGDFDPDNFEQDGAGVEWSGHTAGTMSFPVVGSFFLGMPRGFNRLGPRLEDSQFKLNMFSDWENFGQCFKGYDKYNVPCWKYVNDKGHTFVRGLSPRTNRPFLHIILEDCREKINCIEITEQDLKEMD